MGVHGGADVALPTTESGSFFLPRSDFHLDNIQINNFTTKTTATLNPIFKCRLGYRAVIYAPTTFVDLQYIAPAIRQLTQYPTRSTT